MKNGQILSRLKDNMISLDLPRADPITDEQVDRAALNDYRALFVSGMINSFRLPLQNAWPQSLETESS